MYREGAPHVSIRLPSVRERAATSPHTPNRAICKAKVSREGTTSQEVGCPL
jgi:hypothetical protein